MKRFFVIAAAVTLAATTGCQTLDNWMASWNCGYNPCGTTSFFGGGYSPVNDGVGAGVVSGFPPTDLGGFPTGAPGCSSCASGAVFGPGSVAVQGGQVMPGQMMPGQMMPGQVYGGATLQPTPAQVIPGPADANSDAR